MELTVEYSDVLECTKIFGEKALYELTEDDVECYLAFLGYPKVPSELLKVNNEIEGVLFMLSCKFFQEGINAIANKKKFKKDLEDYHLKLIGYIILNLESKRKLSVHNQLFLKLIELEKPEVACDLESYLRRLKNTVYLSKSLYDYVNHGQTDRNAQILFSYNELNDLTKILVNYVEIFKDVYNRINNESDIISNESKLIINILYVTLKQILILINVVKLNNRVVNDKLVNQLLIFTYYLYIYIREVECKYNEYEGCEKPTESNKDYGNEKEKVENCIKENVMGELSKKDYLLLMNEIERGVVEIVHSPIQSSVLELLNILKNEKGDKEDKEPHENKSDKRNKKDKKMKEECKDDQVERIYGLLLILPKVIRFLIYDIELIHKIVSKIIEFITGEDDTFMLDKDRVSENGVILVRSYYEILVVLKRNSLFIKYNTDVLIKKMVNETLSFVISQLYVLYEVFDRDVIMRDEDKNTLRDQLECYWSILVVISNINLEFIDLNIEKVFELLNKDYKWCSTNELSQKTLLYLMDISRNVSKKGSDDIKMVRIAISSTSNNVNGELEGFKKEDNIYNQYLPSGNFIRNLIVQYVNMNQLGTFFEYIKKYHNKYDGYGSSLDEESVVDEQNEEEEKGNKGFKRKLKSSESNSLSTSSKRIKRSDEVTNYPESDHKCELEVENEGSVVNYLTNYIVLSNIELLNVNNNEIIKIFKILEKYEYEVYSIIIVYLNRLEFNIRNINKVAEQFIKLYNKLEYKCDSQSLILMSQVIVVVRKLISYLNPIEISEYNTEDNDEEDSPKEKNETKRYHRVEEKEEKKYEKELINRLLIIVKDVYEYICKYNDKLIKKGRNNAILNIIYHIMLINNERFPIKLNMSKENKNNVPIDIHNNIEEDKNKENLHHKYKILNMDVNSILSRLLSSSDGNVYSFIAKNIKLFNNNGKVDEFIWKHLNLNGNDKCGNINRKLSLIYFKRFIFSITRSTENKSADEVDLTTVSSNKEDVYQNVNVFLENIIDVDNTEIIKELLSSIDEIYKKIKVKENKRSKGEREELITKNYIDNIIALLEMLLYIINYETLININRCYSMIIEYRKRMEGKMNKKGSKKEFTNIFDIIITIKKMIINNEYYNKEKEKKIVNVFVKYYYIFTICIISHSSEMKDYSIKGDNSNVTNVTSKSGRNDGYGTIGASDNSNSIGTNKMNDITDGHSMGFNKNNNSTIHFNDSSEAINCNSINYIINTNNTYDTNTGVTGNTMGDCNRSNANTGNATNDGDPVSDLNNIGSTIISINTLDSNDDMSINGIINITGSTINIMSNRSRIDVGESGVPQRLEDQRRSLSTSKVLINNLMLNYLQPFKVKGSNKEERRNHWDVYFVYKYVDTMKLNNYDDYCVQIFKENDLIRNIFMSRMHTVNEKNNKQKYGPESIENYINLLYENIQTITSKYVANIMLWNINSYYFKGDRVKVGENVKMELIDSDGIVLRLYLVVLKIVNVFNADKGYVLNLSKKNDEFHTFLKNLFNYYSYFYDQLVNTTISNLASDPDGGEINQYIALFMLINNYNKDNMGEEMYNNVWKFVKNKQKYIKDKMVGKKCDRVFNKDSSKKRILSGNREKTIIDEILFNYLIINKLYNVNGVIKNDMIKLIQIIMNVLGGGTTDVEGDNSISSDGNSDKFSELTQIMLKLINALVVNNINRNISIIVYFYHQYNNIVLKGFNANYRDLIRFTNLIVNANNYKYIKNSVPIVLNILIQTFYYISNKHRMGSRPQDAINKGDVLGNVKAEDSDTHKDHGKMLGKYEDKEESSVDRTKEYTYEKNKQILKNNIIRCIIVCEDKIKDNIYKLIKNNNIKIFYKEQFQPQK